MMLLMMVVMMKLVHCQHHGYPLTLLFSQEANHQRAHPSSLCYITNAPGQTGTVLCKSLGLNQGPFICGH